MTLETSVCNSWGGLVALYANQGVKDAVAREAKLEYIVNRFESLTIKCCSRIYIHNTVFDAPADPLIITIISTW